jgi:hypothetical protein
VFGSIDGVIAKVYVVPPSNDSQSSISQYDGNLIRFGFDVVHSTFTLSPGWRTCPALGEISIGEKLGGGGGIDQSREGAKANASNNNVMNPRVFIFDTSLWSKNYRPQSKLCQTISPLLFCHLFRTEEMTRRDDSISAEAGT